MVWIKHAIIAKVDEPSSYEGKLFLKYFVYRKIHYAMFESATYADKTV